MSGSSPWLAVDPEATEDVRVPDLPDGLLVTFGFWPPTIENKLRAKLRGVSIFRKPEDRAEPASPDDLEAQLNADEAILAEAVRWSVRGWKGEPAAAVESAKIGERSYPRLTDASLDRVRRNGLLPLMAVAAASFNITPPQGKGGSGAS
jgi:hypothetical protein